MSLAISIIIPAFNIEGYLPACIDSIVHQVNDEVEVIIVNDGSTDNTGKIADQYALNYSYITVIHQTNQGVSAARNRGLIEAQGDYVWFVDGDDLIADNSIALLIKWIKNDPADVVFFKNQTFIAESKEFFFTRFDNIILIEEGFIARFSDLIEQGIISYSSCDKIVKHDLLISNNINFDTELTYSEDYLWNYQLFNLINKFSYTNQVLYYYRKSREQSATTQLSLTHLYSALQALELTIENIKSSSADTKTLKSLLLYTSQNFFYILPEFYRSHELTPENSLKFYSIYQIYKDNNVELSSINKGSKVFEIIYDWLSWHNTVCLYSQIVYFRRKIQLYLLKKMK